jgi:hypothetical protein
MRTSILALAGLLLLAGPVRAQSPLFDGLDRIHVEVDHLSDLVLDAGYDAERVHRDVALELGRAGFIVLSALDTIPPGPAVAINFDATETPYGAVAYYASLELREDVSLSRSPESVAKGSVWYTSTLGIASPGSMEEEVQAVLDRLVETFLLDAGRITLAP